MFFVKTNARAADQANEVLRAKAAQGTPNKGWVEREKVPGLRLSVGEVATTPPTDADLFANLGGMIQHQDPQSPLAGDGCAEEPRRPCPQDNQIEWSGQFKTRSGQTAERPRP